MMRNAGGVQFKTRLPLSAWLFFALVTLFPFSNSSLHRPMTDPDRGHNGKSVWYSLGVIEAAILEAFVENVGLAAAGRKKTKTAPLMYAGIRG